MLQWQNINTEISDCNHSESHCPPLKREEIQRKEQTRGHASEWVVQKNCKQRARNCIRAAREHKSGVSSLTQKIR